MRYLATICIIFCFLGSGVSYAPSQCVDCDTIPVDSVKKIMASAAREEVNVIMDSLRGQIDKVAVKHRILLLKTAMVERKLCKPVIGRIDSFRTLKGYYIIEWIYKGENFYKTNKYYTK